MSFVTDHSPFLVEEGKVYTWAKRGYYATVYSSSHGMKQLVVLLLPPGWDASPSLSYLPPPLPSLITLWNNSNITWLGGESSIITTLKGLSVHFILFKILPPNKKKTKHTKSVLNHNLKLGQCLKSTVFYMTITTMAEGCNNKFKNGIYPFNQMIIRETLVNVFPWEKSRHCTKKSLKMSAQYVTSVWIFSILFSIHFPQCC